MYANPEITYGEVKSFTTKPCLTCGQTAIETLNPIVLSGSNAYLNGFYNSTDTVKTFFEYRKIPAMTSSSVKQTTNSNSSEWIKVNPQNKVPNTAGAINFLLQGLTPNTQYEYRAAAEVNPTTNGANSDIVYAEEIFPFTTGDVVTPNQGNGGDNGDGGGNYQNTPNLPTKPPLHPQSDNLVHYSEGVETVFIRQIIGNTAFAKVYGYKDGMNLQSFAYGLAHTFAQLFGYIHGGAREIRVSSPDVAAYIFGLQDGKLVVFEYYKNYYTGTATFTMDLKNAFGYEYYFNRKL